MPPNSSSSFCGRNYALVSCCMLHFVSRWNCGCQWCYVEMGSLFTFKLLDRSGIRPFFRKYCSLVHGSTSRCYKENQYNHSVCETFKKLGWKLIDCIQQRLNTVIELFKPLGQTLIAQEPWIDTICNDAVVETFVCAYCRYNCCKLHSNRFGLCQFGPLSHGLQVGIGGGWWDAENHWSFA